MPPTVHSQASSTSKQQAVSSQPPRYGDRPAAKKEDKAGLLSRIRYNNTLPDIPFDPKFIAYPFDHNRFVQYKPTTLESNHKFELLTEGDVGVQIDLINPDAYVPAVGAILDPEDERLLEDDAPSGSEVKRKQQHSRVVPWLRKTEYISSEFNRFGTGTERHETKVGYNVKKLLSGENLYKDRESQVEAIKRTFDAVAPPVHKHYSKPGVYALQELPVYPDFDLWKFAWAQVIFDADPLTAAQPLSMASQALIRGMRDEEKQHFVAYLLPTEETIEKRQRDAEQGAPYTEGETYDYKLTREYNWNVKNKASKGYEENYFFVLRDDGCFYNELETRVRLNKRRNREGSNRNTRLVVTHRPLNDEELAAQRARLTQLQEPVAEIETEEGEQEEEEEEGSEQVTVKQENVRVAATTDDDGGEKEDEPQAKKAKFEPKAEEKSAAAEPDELPSDEEEAKSTSSGSDDDEDDDDDGSDGSGSESDSD